MKKFLVIIVMLALVGVGFLAFGHSRGREILVATATPTPENISDFSIQVPDGFTMRAVSASISETIYTIENDKGVGFQIFASDFDEPGPITEERVYEDLPDAVVNEPGQATLDGAASFVFYGEDEDLGETFEVWAVHHGKLFQIMGRKADEELVIKTINTWKWK